MANKTEATIQKALISWCRERSLFALAFHVDQGGKNTIGQASQAKRMGRLAGIPDICIPLPLGRVLWLELKTKKGRLSKAQKAMHREMYNLDHEVFTAYGYEQAIEYLSKIDAEYKSEGLK